MMNPTSSETPGMHTVEGTIHRVDTSSRELTLLVDGVYTDLVVPPDCFIRLNGERVRLRLLQPGDRAEVAYSYVGRTAYAHSIQVNWLPRVAAASKAQKATRSVGLPKKGPPGSTENLS